MCGVCLAAAVRSVFLSAMPEEELHLRSMVIVVFRCGVCIRIKTMARMLDY